MKQIALTVRIITPTLMGGAFGQNDGIRPSEIKGLMRYWFRAVAGSFIGDNLLVLKGLEEKIFGSTNKKSTFRILIKNQNLSFLDEDSSELTFKMNGITYLGIGNVLFRWDRNSKSFIFNKEKINIISPSSNFTIIFSFLPNLKSEIKRLIALSFYLTTAFGGFGLRARRGFGSWQIIKSSVKIKDFDFENYDENSINRAIELAEENLKNLTNFKSKNISSSYPNLSRYRFLQIQTQETDWHKVLNKLGALYRGYRVNPITPKIDDFKPKHTKDYDEILKLINNGDKNITLSNPIFGLNIQYSSSSDRSFKASVELQRKKDKKWETLRRASPVFFSLKSINGNVTLNLFVSYSKFKPDSYKIAVKSNKLKQPKFVKIKNYQVVDSLFDFINQEFGTKESSK